MPDCRYFTKNMKPWKLEVPDPKPIEPPVEPPIISPIPDTDPEPDDTPTVPVEPVPEGNNSYENRLKKFAENTLALLDEAYELVRIYKDR